ncbi:NlpC/P60 family protein [Streptomyces sp. NPDC058848]|uniref:NlpC/P60 family protein n=1 Tax=Streptomyces sp. NPDC058848 TaxID=3346650 RepID=UPI0036C12A50
MAQQGLPGIAVGMAGAAALLIYAGFRGSDPLDALRDVATGKPKGLAERAAMRSVLYEGLDAPGGGGGGGGGGGVTQASLEGAAVSGPHPEFVRAAAQFQNDKYSQARRWQKGYSDCSSFVGKALKAAGVTPPGGSTTSSYLAWSKARPISRDEIGAGDFLVSSGHMALAINNSTAIGQQNGRQNVQVGPISTIMWGQSWVALRYTGASRGGSVRT